MKFIVERNWIDILVKIWMPVITAGLRIDLSIEDVRNIGTPTRENVSRWLNTHSGYFSKVLDFHAIVGEEEIPWEHEESEIDYSACVEGDQG